MNKLASNSKRSRIWLLGHRNFSNIVLTIEATITQAIDKAYTFADRITYHDNAI